MGVFENDRSTYSEDWKDAVNAQLQWMKKEIEALRMQIEHMNKVNGNIKIDVERAIQNCYSTVNGMIIRSKQKKRK